MVLPGHSGLKGDALVERRVVDAPVGEHRGGRFGELGGGGRWRAACAFRERQELGEVLDAGHAAHEGRGHDVYHGRRVAEPVNVGGQEGRRVAYRGDEEVESLAPRERGGADDAELRVEGGAERRGDGGAVFSYEPRRGQDSPGVASAISFNVFT